MRCGTGYCAIGATSRLPAVGSGQTIDLVRVRCGTVSEVWPIGVWLVMHGCVLSWILVSLLPVLVAAASLFLRLLI